MEKQPLPDEYVCPNCGAPARGASECRSCGANLDSLTDLPRQRDYTAGGPESLRAGFIEKPASEPAPGGLGLRFVAAFIDNLVVLAVSAGVGLATYAAAGEDAGYMAGYGACVVIFLFYPPVMLAFVNGQTLGKKAVGVQVRNATGDAIGFGRAFLRELLKSILGVFTFPIVASGLVGISRTDKRTLHDLMLGTRVIKAG